MCCLNLVAVAQQPADVFDKTRPGTEQVGKGLKPGNHKQRLAVLKANHLLTSGQQSLKAINKAEGPPPQYCVTLPGGFSVTMTESRETRNGKPQYFSPAQGFEMFYDDEWIFKNAREYNTGYGSWDNPVNESTPPTSNTSTWSIDETDYFEGNITVSAGACSFGPPQQLCVTLPDGKPVTLTDANEPYWGGPTFYDETGDFQLYRYIDEAPARIGGSMLKDASDDPSIYWYFETLNETDGYADYINQSDETTVPTGPWEEVEGVTEIMVQLGACSSCSAALGATGIQAGVLSTTTCQVGITAIGTGRSFVFAGPDGYTFSNIFRQCGTYSIRADKITKPGTYTLTIYGENESDKTIIPIQVTGMECPK